MRPPTPVHPASAPTFRHAPSLRSSTFRCSSCVGAPASGRSTSSAVPWAILRSLTPCVGRLQSGCPGARSSKNLKQLSIDMRETGQADRGQTRGRAGNRPGGGAPKRDGVTPLRRRRLQAGTRCPLPAGIILCCVPAHLLCAEQVTAIPLTSQNSTNPGYLNSCTEAHRRLKCSDTHLSSSTHCQLLLAWLD